MGGQHQLKEALKKIEAHIRRLKRDNPKKYTSLFKEIVAALREYKDDLEAVMKE